MVNFFVYEAIITVGRDEMSVKRTVSLHLQLLHVYVHMDVTKGNRSGNLHYTPASLCSKASLIVS